jgi:F-type H+-transporting ATPase subunit delta
MDQVQSDLIKRALEKSTGKTIIMGTRVDPQILGGVIARVGDQLIDNSVRYRLQALQRELLTGVVSSIVDYAASDVTQEFKNGFSTDTKGATVSTASVS